ncbi:hypothetical protein HGRIS_014680 [Hohenbuehelia grisea]|uniref:RING-type domain-containing protein n=1 Tax=Hohenbuehelia grisea TaxID=104357 RepID=A0ABR3JV48_9AGAR
MESRRGVYNSFSISHVLAGSNTPHSNPAHNSQSARPGRRPIPVEHFGIIKALSKQLKVNPTQRDDPPPPRAESSGSSPSAPVPDTHHPRSFPSSRGPSGPSDRSLESSIAHGVYSAHVHDTFPVDWASCGRRQASENCTFAPTPNNQDSPTSSNDIHAICASGRTKRPRTGSIERDHGSHRRSTRLAVPTRQHAGIVEPDHEIVARMREEIEVSKAKNAEQEKIMETQRDQIEELETKTDELDQGGCDVHQKQHQRDLKIGLTNARSTKNDKLLSTIRNSLQCQICLDLLKNPYSIPSCGHISCLRCLQAWFRKAPEVNEEDLNDSSQSKTCPFCRAIVKNPPVPAFVVRAITTAISQSPASPERDGGNPWEGLFSQLQGDEDMATTSDEEDMATISDEEEDMATISDEEEDMATISDEEEDLATISDDEEDGVTTTNNRYDWDIPFSDFMDPRMYGLDLDEDEEDILGFEADEAEDTEGDLNVLDFM